MKPERTKSPDWDVVAFLLHCIQTNADIWWACGNSAELQELVRRALAAHGYTPEQITAAMRCQHSREPREVELECELEELKHTLLSRTEEMRKFVDNLDDVRGEAQLLLDEWTADDHDDKSDDDASGDAGVAR